MLNQIVSQIQKTASLVEEITVSSREQSHGTGEVKLAIQQLNRVVQQYVASSEELTASAEQLSDQASSLIDIMKYFTVEEEENDVELLEE